MNVVQHTLGLVATVALLLMSAVVDAGAFRTYLSVKGDDANSCSVVAPCRLLPAALAAVNDGGEVWILDSANYNISTVVVDKSVTILAVPGALGSVVANGGDAISIFAAGVNVTLRNLNVLNLSGAGQGGINMRIGSSVSVENCEVYGLAYGIYIQAPGETATIRNTVIRNNGVGFLGTGTSSSTLDGVTVSANTTGVEAHEGAHVTVSNSTIANNQASAVSAWAQGVTGTVLVVAHSTITGHDTYSVGTYVLALVNLTAEAFVETSALHITTGFQFAGTGGTEKIFSSGDNRLVYYTANVMNGTLTPRGGI